MGDKITAKAVKQSVDAYNQDKKLSWTLGTNYTNVGTEFETYVNHYLFPKLQETKVINRQLGNRFNFLAKETPYIGQLSEEYVIMDSVPVDLDLCWDSVWLEPVWALCMLPQSVSSVVCGK